MAQENKYSIRDLKRDFSTQEDCLRFIFEALHTEDCSCGGYYTLLEGRKKFQCSKCRYQIAPLTGTIFHKSSTPLPLWFHALFVFSNAKSSISAKELERQLGVTYKTAWRMLNLIRTTLKQDEERLSGDVEVDAAMFGGRYKAGKNNIRTKEMYESKAKVVGAVERGGRAKAFVTNDLKATSFGAFLNMHIDPENTRLLTDKSNVYKNVAKGFDRHVVDHHIQEYVRDDIHVNNVESFWSHMKRSLKGTHKVISKEYLQTYVDAFVWHHNNRHNDRHRFGILLGAVLQNAQG